MLLRLWMFMLWDVSLYCLLSGKPPYAVQGTPLKLALAHRKRPDSSHSRHLFGTGATSSRC